MTKDASPRIDDALPRLEDAGLFVARLLNELANARGAAVGHPVQRTIEAALEAVYDCRSAIQAAAQWIKIRGGTGRMTQINSYIDDPKISLFSSLPKNSDCYLDVAFEEENGSSSSTVIRFRTQDDGVAFIDEAIAQLQRIRKEFTR